MYYLFYNTGNILFKETIMENKQRVYIKGNSKRGAEVIKFLKNLGGYNSYYLDGHNSNNYYFIDPIDGTINNTGVSSLVFSFLKTFYKEIELPKWEPECSESYYFIDDRGNIIQSKWYNTRTDDWRYTFGNCFKTAEEAGEAINKIKEVLNNNE